MRSPGAELRLENFRGSGVKEDNLMELYIALKLNAPAKALLVTDLESAAQASVEAERLADPNSEYAVLNTSNLTLTAAAQASISLDYDLTCLEGVVESRLNDIGVDREKCPKDFDELVSEIAVDAQNDILRYGFSEDGAIEDAIQMNKAGINSLMDTDCDSSNYDEDDED